MRNLLVGEFLPVWIVDFPMFEYDYDSRSWLGAASPVYGARSEDEEKLSENPGQAIACAYDLVVTALKSAAAAFAFIGCKHNWRRWRF